MPAHLEVSQTFDRPVAKVFHFLADEHVRNHPRWDPYMELTQVSGGPMQKGTMIRRRSTRSGQPVDGTMEVLEFERNQVVGVVVHDGPVEMRSRMIFTAVSGDQTVVTITVDLPGMDESMDMSPLITGIEGSMENMKRLIESEV